MTVVQTDATPIAVECTSTHLVGTAQVSVDLKAKQVEENFRLTKTSLYDDIFDVLKDKEYSSRDVSTLLRLFGKLGRDVTTGTHKYLRSDGVHRVNMNMKVHDVLETFMKDQELAVPGSIHDKVNKLFLPAGMTFVHDIVDNCVIEVREEEDVD